MLAIQKITDPESGEVKILADLAFEIWHEHFVSILSEEQIEYMVEKFQSEPAMRAQLENQGYLYYLAREDGEPAAYAAIVPNPEEESIFLSKLYVKKEHRGKGFSRQLMNYLFEEIFGCGYRKILLTCNKRNENSLAVYRHMGFLVTDEVVTPIGNGMVMDDYVMTLLLPE